MKKLLAALVILFVLLPLCARAAGTNTCQPPVTIGNGALATMTVTCSFVGDASTGVVPSAIVGAFPGWFPYQIDISPGTTAPTGYSMTLTFPIGSTNLDLVGGNGTGISATAGTWQVLTFGGKGFRRNIGETITLNVTNTTASGNGSVTVSFIPQ